MVAQGSSIGRALSGRFRSAGKSSVLEIAILYRFLSVIGQFQRELRDFVQSKANEILAGSGFAAD